MRRRHANDDRSVAAVVAAGLRPVNRVCPQQAADAISLHRSGGARLQLWPAGSGTLGSLSAGGGEARSSETTRR